MAEYVWKQKGAEVEQLQSSLMAKGYTLPKYGSDGDLGSETWGRVESFAGVDQFPTQQPLPEAVQFTSVHYALDPMIWPPTNAILPYPEADNHFINKVGHAQPLYCSRATRIAIRALYGEG